MRTEFITVCFEISFAPKKGKGRFASLKCVEVSRIPSCKNCHPAEGTWHQLAACDKMTPQKPLKGWELVEKTYQLVWFTGSWMPDTVLPDSAYSTEDDDDSDSRTLLRLRFQ